MVVKFEVGKIYFSVYSVWNKEGKAVQKKKYWLCVKRNESTRYVSFRQILDKTISSTVESRKAKVESPAIFSTKDGKSVSFEEITIGYGGSGYWRNYHVIAAINEVKGKTYKLEPKKKTKKSGNDYGIKGDWRPFEGM